MIRLQHVSMVFGAGPSRVAALNDVSFHVAKGEFVVLSGASGAGKTTLLRLLYAAEMPSEGDIDVAGFDVAALRRSEIPRLRRSIGIVFQDSKLLAGRTVFENVAFVLRVLGTSRRDITPKAFAALKAVGLSSRAQAYPRPALPGRGAAGRAGAGHRQVARPAPRRRADRQPGRGDGRRDPRRWSRTSGAAGTTVLFATHQARLAAAAQAPHPHARRRPPREGRGLSGAQLPRRARRCATCAAPAASAVSRDPAHHALARRARRLLARSRSTSAGPSPSGATGCASSSYLKDEPPAAELAISCSASRRWVASSGCATSPRPRPCACSSARSAPRPTWPSSCRAIRCPPRSR